MATNYIQNSLEVFIEDLASSRSTPGGGSVSALVGLNAVALILMVLRISEKKKAYQKYQKEIQESIQKAEQLKDRFKKKIDEDIRVFQKLLASYRQKQKKVVLNSNPESKKEDSKNHPLKENIKENIDETTKEITEKIIEETIGETIEETVDFCFSVLEDGLEALKLSMELTFLKNSVLSSDVAIALILSFATMETAQENVQINLRSLSETKQKRMEIEKNMQILMEEAKKIKEQGLASTWALLEESKKE